MLKNRRNKHKTNKVTDLSPNISKITFHLNDLSMQSKGRLSKRIHQHNPSMLPIKISLQALQHSCIKSENERVSFPVVSDSLQPHELQITRLLCPWNSPSKNTGVGIHSLLQEFFPTQGLNAGLLHYTRIFYHLSHQGSIN